MSEAEVIERYVSRLDGIDRRSDREMAHDLADQNVIEALRALGAGAIADAWDRCVERHGGFWYA